MRKGTHVLCLVACCLLAIGFATDSFARPNDCSEECTIQCPCSLVCWYWGITNCGVYSSGVCNSGLQAETETFQWGAVNDWQSNTPAMQPKEQPEESRFATEEE